ncbi:GNAT family N-acetyltransferase [Thermoleptolyngbya sp. M55_K2018_002]|uniref:GNAT family N-acetyltransferase n=1 Tax=Thermoleptolyngbya sp. M55_K2018_002 TaxID=2747808 RepID=UPI001A00FE03|nr:GNAT family N-acetyltransferase [Thermoleptolyngbya sp. M55_K2018_002]HIK42245.1 GNAT family N-acetyltransferase [Thermoleptolyngbya sp. M55_K2018_002]
MLTPVTTWYLEMLSPEWLRPTLSSRADLVVMQAKVPSPEFSRFLYTAVGGDWYWLQRLSWSYEQWLRYLDRPQVQTWVAYVSGTPAGYVELEAQPDENVEIAYFGLLGQFMGQGLGGHLLTVGTQQAWKMGAKRVWVHTCSLDGPYALKNYQSRGFKLYDQQVHSEDLPEQPPGPWA